MKSIEPDLSSRPLDCTVEAAVSVAPDVVYRAFTADIDRWFATPGHALMRPALDAPFFFETEMDGTFHPHYGRFLALEADRHVRMTWMTGDPGTLGAETVVTLDIEQHDGGSRVRLNHAGFADEASRDGHADAWPEVFKHLDNCLADK